MAYSRQLTKWQSYIALLDYFARIYSGYISSPAEALDGSKLLIAYLNLSRVTIFLAFTQLVNPLAIGMGEARRASAADALTAHSPIPSWCALFVWERHFAVFYKSWSCQRCCRPSRSIFSSFNSQFHFVFKQFTLARSLSKLPSYYPAQRIFLRFLHLISGLTSISLEVME